MDTVRANESALHLPVEVSSYRFEVGTPGALGFIIGVADIVTDRSAFSANRTNSCHNAYLRILSIISVVEKPFK
jgi:hypothetical protein